MMARKSRIEACPPLPEMPAHKINAVSGVGRRVVSSGETEGHLYSYVTSKPLSEERGGVYTLDTSGSRLESGTVGRKEL